MQHIPRRRTSAVDPVTFNMTATRDPRTITIKYYMSEGVAYLDQMQHPGPEPHSRMPLHTKTPRGEGLKRLRIDDLAYIYVTTAWMDAYYHGKWWSAVEVFGMSGHVDCGYHQGKHLIGQLWLLMRHRASNMFFMEFLVIDCSAEYSMTVCECLINITRCKYTRDSASRHSPSLYTR